MVEVVFRHHGTVDKFVGDMVMALFGAPVDDPDHAEHALAAAVEMVGELGELNRKWRAEGKVQLDIGIGVNSGDMIAGNIGSPRIMSYTVIGDNVNLGSRLESLNKEYRTRIIISDATRTRLRTAQYTIRAARGRHGQGQDRPVAIFEVVVPSPLPRVARTRGNALMKTRPSLVVAAAARGDAGICAVRQASPTSRARRRSSPTSTCRSRKSASSANGSARPSGPSSACCRTPR